MWHKIRVTVVDPTRTALNLWNIDIEAKSLSQLTALLAAEILRVYDSSSSPHAGGLKGVLVGGLELTSWDSSSSCEAPGEVERQALLVMRESAKAVLSSGSSLRKPGTGTGNSGSSLN